VPPEYAPAKFEIDPDAERPAVNAHACSVFVGDQRYRVQKADVGLALAGWIEPQTSSTISMARTADHDPPHLLDGFA